MLEYEKNCQLIKDFILEKNIENAEFNFNIITKDDDSIIIKPNTDLRIDYDKENMNFYHGDTLVGQAPSQELAAVLLAEPSNN